MTVSLATTIALVTLPVVLAIYAYAGYVWFRRNFKFRPGHTYRIFDSVARVHSGDFSRNRAILIFDPNSNAACYRPRVTVLVRWRSRKWLDCAGRAGISERRISFVLPHLTWATAYRYRSFGALRFYKRESRMYYRLFSTAR